jgi:hypothetical protein
MTGGTSDGNPASKADSVKPGETDPISGLFGGGIGAGFGVTVASFSGILEDVILPMGLRLNRVQVQGMGLSAQINPIDAQLQTPASLEVLVSQDALEEFLTSKAPGGLRDFSVNLEGGRIHVTATLHVLIDMRASAVCRLEIQNRTRMVAVLESAGVLGVTAKNLIQAQIDNINPVFDAEMLPIPCELQDVTIESGWIRVRGTVHSPASSNSA